MIFAQANLGRGVQVDEFVLNFRRLMREAGPRAVVNLQEIDEADKPEEMDFILDEVDKTHRVYGQNTAVPILVPNHLHVVEHRVKLASKGLAKYTPNRPLNEVLIEVGPNLQVADLNIHLPINRPQTFSRRKQCRQTLRQRASEYENGAWFSDTNTRVGWPRIVKGEQHLIRAGIDKAKVWAEPSRRVVISDYRRVDLTIDGHDGHVVRAFWRNR